MAETLRRCHDLTVILAVSRVLDDLIRVITSLRTRQCFILPIYIFNIPQTNLRRTRKALPSV